MSLVSGSQVSGAPAKKKRGRKSKAERASVAAAEALRDGSPSVAGGAGGRAPTVMSGVSGPHQDRKDVDQDGGKEGEFEMPENMASVSAARTKEQIEEEKELYAMVKSQMDTQQFHRYEVWRRSTLKPADVKRVCYSNLYYPCFEDGIANY